MCCGWASCTGAKCRLRSDQLIASQHRPTYPAAELDALCDGNGATNGARTEGSEDECGSDGDIPAGRSEGDADRLRGSIGGAGRGAPYCACALDGRGACCTALELDVDTIGGRGVP